MNFTNDGYIGVLFGRPFVFFRVNPSCCSLQLCFFDVSFSYFISTPLGFYVSAFLWRKYSNICTAHYNLEHFTAVTNYNCTSSYDQRDARTTNPHIRLQSLHPFATISRQPYEAQPTQVDFAVAKSAITPPISFSHLSGVLASLCHLPTRPRRFLKGGLAPHRLKSFVPLRLPSQPSRCSLNDTLLLPFVSTHTRFSETVVGSCGWPTSCRASCRAVHEQERAIVPPLPLPSLISSFTRMTGDDCGSNA